MAPPRLCPSPPGSKSFLLTTHIQRGFAGKQPFCCKAMCVSYYPQAIRVSEDITGLGGGKKGESMLPEVSHVSICICLCMYTLPTTFPLICTHNANKAFSSLSCALSFPIFVSMAARAVAYSEPSCCSDGLQSSKSGKVGEEQEDRRSPAGVDYVRRSVLVEVGTLSLIVAVCCIANRCFRECYIIVLVLFECTG